MTWTLGKWKWKMKMGMNGKIDVAKSNYRPNTRVLDTVGF